MLWCQVIFVTEFLDSVSTLKARDRSYAIAYKNGTLTTQDEVYHYFHTDPFQSLRHITGYLPWSRMNCSSVIMAFAIVRKYRKPKINNIHGKYSVTCSNDSIIDHVCLKRIQCNSKPMQFLNKSLFFRDLELSWQLNTLTSQIGP